MTKRVNHWQLCCVPLTWNQAVTSRKDSCFEKASSWTFKFKLFRYWSKWSTNVLDRFARSAGTAVAYTISILILSTKAGRFRYVSNNLMKVIKTILKCILADNWADKSDFDGCDTEREIGGGRKNFSATDSGTDPLAADRSSEAVVSATWRPGAHEVERIHDVNCVGFCLISWLLTSFISRCRKEKLVKRAILVNGFRL